MKKFLWPALLGLAVLTGCANRYLITLNNGNQMTARGKPKLDEATGTYYFKDGEGKPAAVPAIRVREIAPQ